MASNTAIIGRVAVRVMPDTSDFRRDTERQLNRLEKSLKITVPTTVNMAGAKRDALTGVRDLNTELRSRDSYKVRFGTTLSTDGARDAVTRVRRQLQELADQKKIEFKVDDLDAAHVRLGVDRESMASAEDEIDRFRKRVSPVKVDVDVDRGIAERASAVLAGLLGVVLRLASTGAQLGAVATGVAGIAAASLAGASNLFALSASLAQIGPAALLLPGLLGGIAIGVGVMVAALKDFGTVFPDVKASLSAMQDAISSNFWAEAEAPVRRLIDTLLPQLDSGFQSTATALGGYFAGLAASLTGAFDGALAGMFADLSKSIDIASTGTDALAGIIRTLGEVGAGYLPRLATFFVAITTQFDAFLAKASADGRLKQWIDTGITALLDLGSVLSSVFVILASIGTAAAAAGGSSLAVLADALQRVADIVSGPAFQTGLTAVFAAAHEALDRIATLSGPAVATFFATLGEVLTAILPIAGEALGTALAALATALVQVEVQRAVVAMFDALLVVVQALAPILPPLAAVLAVALTAAFTTVGAAVQAVSRFLSEHTTTATVLAGVLTAVVIPALTAWGIASVLNSVKAAASWLTTATSAQASATVQTRSAAQVVVGWVAKAAAATLNAAKVIAGWAATGAAAIASAVVHVAQVGVMVAKWAFLAAQSLASAAKVAAAWLIAMGPIGLVIAAVIGLVVVVVRNWDTIKAKTAELWNAVKEKTVETWSKVQSAVSDGVAKVVGFVRDMGVKIASAITAPQRILLNAGRQIIEGLLNGLTAGFGRVREKLGELTSMLPDWKGPEPVDRMLLFDAGSLIIKGLINGLESQYDGVKQSLQGLTSDIGSTLIDSPQMAEIAAPRSGSAGIAGSLTSLENGPSVIVQKTLVYNAAPGSSLGAEEDLFAATSRTRAVGW